MLVECVRRPVGKETWQWRTSSPNFLFDSASFGPGNCFALIGRRGRPAFFSFLFEHLFGLQSISSAHSANPFKPSSTPARRTARVVKSHARIRKPNKSSVSPSNLSRVALLTSLRSSFLCSPNFCQKTKKPKKTKRQTSRRDDREKKT